MLKFENNERNNLKNRLKEAKVKLLDVLEDWHYMQNILKPRLDFTYDAIFGDLEFELNTRVSHALELDRRIEILSFKVNRGEKINSNAINNVNLIIEKEQKNRREIANSWKIESNQAKNAEELSTLYRQLVKKIHPDTAGDNNEYLHFWENVQSSYKTGNVDRIKLFYQTICKEIETNEMNQYEEERLMNNEIRNIEANINIEKRKIEKLKNEEPFCFEDRFKDQIWVKSRMKQIQDRIMYTELKIQRNKRYLSKYEKAEPLVTYFQSSNSNNTYKQSYAS